MSLSYEPPVKITLSTPKDICGDIWAGAIQFADESGFSANPLITMMLWSGLLLTVKKDLEEHGVFDAVQEEFVPSFAYIYDIGLDRVELLADIKQKQKDFWEIISQEMGDLHTNLEVSLFLHLVNDVNMQLEQQNTGMPLADCVKLFNTTRVLLSSHVYNILHKIDNEMLLQFKNARSSLSHPVRKQTTQAAPQPAKPQDSSSKASGKKNVLSILKWIIVALIIVNVIVMMVSFWPSDSAQPATAPQETQVQQLEAKPRPRNGEIIKGNGFGESEITITASTTDDHVVSLKTASGTLRLAFYVRAGQTVTVKVPAERLYVYFASGEKWYGYGKGLMFGEDTVYSKDDEVLDFTEYTWEYTLHPVSNGNFSETPIGENEFF